MDYVQPSQRAASRSICLRAQAVAEILDISPRTLYRKVSQGAFPRPIKIGPGTTRWRLSDVEAYLEGRRPR